MPEKLNHWINGVGTEPSSGEWMQSINPATGELSVSVARGTKADVDSAVSVASAAASDWRWFKAAHRGRLLYRLAQSIRDNAEHLATLETEDSGKPLSLSLAEVEGSAAYFEFYAGLVNIPLGDTLDVDPRQHVYTKREPYGVVGVITPWNLPLNQSARSVAPALAAGNVVVAKPAEAASQTTVMLAELATQVGIPNGVFNVVLGKGREVGEEIVRHPDVRKVAFTGSVAVGKSIGHIAAERIIPLTLELGGKSANIVFEDADLEFAAREAVRAFTTNAGQICSSGTRLLVQRSVYEEFVAKVAELSGRLRPSEDYGPMITEDQYQQVQRYFEVAAKENLVAVTGGSVVGSAGREGGFYVNPTVYVDVNNSTKIAREEIFGPVVAAIPFDTEEEALRIANDSEFGLVGAVWSRDISRALRVADRIEAGQIFVNTWSTGAVETPFGGHKHSGYGREKGIEALNHYSHLKCVIVALEQA
ncbi:aldehyde dehydrogenase family protein [Pseudarthrobacter sp. H3Y2-7]|uniref:aldehyde dehydrogenase family protein n=1 Tax=Pseudarthrobacter naphthalenicus TaxID=3031328 RepID=UPI0023AF51FB|nr:aldehyde dehydrogenase family protein [Pseudarthrobacter sp. H3Y2-7]MDE8671003.1 aldehyde dehydrogenase family protein [Pseudarthrobacter sp. H3Y2-7]